MLHPKALPTNCLPCPRLPQFGRTWVALCYAGELASTAWGASGSGLAFTLDALYPRAATLPGGWGSACMGLPACSWLLLAFGMAHDHLSSPGTYLLTCAPYGHAQTPPQTHPHPAGLGRNFLSRALLDAADAQEALALLSLPGQVGVQYTGVDDVCHM